MNSLRCFGAIHTVIAFLWLCAFSLTNAQYGGYGGSIMPANNRIAGGAYPYGAYGGGSPYSGGYLGSTGSTYGKPSYAYLNTYGGYGLSGYEGPYGGRTPYWQPGVAYPPGADCAILASTGQCANSLTTRTQCPISCGTGCPGDFFPGGEFGTGAGAGTYGAGLAGSIYSQYPNTGGYGSAGGLGAGLGGYPQSSSKYAPGRNSSISYQPGLSGSYSSQLPTAFGSSSTTYGLPGSYGSTTPNFGAGSIYGANNPYGSSSALGGYGQGGYGSLGSGSLGAGPYGAGGYGAGSYGAGGYGAGAYGSGINLQCEDSHIFGCQNWAQQGLCQTVPEYMLVYCRASCGVCGGGYGSGYGSPLGSSYGGLGSSYGGLGSNLGLGSGLGYTPGLGLGGSGLGLGPTGLGLGTSPLGYDALFSTDPAFSNLSPSLSSSADLLANNPGLLGTPSNADLLSSDPTLLGGGLAGADQFGLGNLGAGFLPYNPGLSPFGGKSSAFAEKKEAKPSAMAFQSSPQLALDRSLTSAGLDKTGAVPQLTTILKMDDLVTH
ncbi:shK domain-like domain-containing protein [Ditylenchus destructor]|nr:shK domain-like domain-containing protein [Ditylenchus destructor]